MKLDVINPLSRNASCSGIFIYNYYDKQACGSLYGKWQLHPRNNYNIKHNNTYRRNTTQGYYLSTIFLRVFCQPGCSIFFVNTVKKYICLLPLAICSVGYERVIWSSPGANHQKCSLKRYHDNCIYFLVAKVQRLLPCCF